MHLKNVEALSRVFDNFEHLNDEYGELPKKADAEDRAWNCLKEKGISVFEVESLINEGTEKLPLFCGSFFFSTYK